jgi:hypothetical protein
LETAAVIAGLVGAGVVLSRRRLIRSTTWRAAITPLASIIGSGFLVLAPLLADTVGPWAPLAMLGIVAAGYALGASIRFNIVHAEPLLGAEEPPATIRDVERVSRFALGLAYVISVAFYLRLMAAFVLGAVGADTELNGRVVTTAVLAVIGVVGLVRGLHGIEAIEIPAVTLKLAVVGALLAGMVAFFVLHASASIDAFSAHTTDLGAVTVARRLAGMLLVVQGFETSRYLGHYYDAGVRVRSMRDAQIISGAIYVTFAALLVPLFGHLGAGSRETAVLDVARFVAPVLVPLLVVAAVASQLSAATADTAGGSEMLTDRPRHRGGNVGYPAVVLAAAVVVWLADTFAIVSLASRAFAFYYLCQAGVTALVAARLGTRRGRGVVVASLVLAAALLFVVVAAIPGE